MKVGVILSGCGVYDGAEIQEALMAMLAIQEQGWSYQCYSINKDQHHVVNHLTGEEQDETRNVMVEAARIARGDVKEVSPEAVNDVDAILIPGGFGSAKNFSSWAFDGPKGNIDPNIKTLLNEFHAAGKPIVALCVSPVLVALALEGVSLTLGSTKEPSPYEISGFAAGVESVGAKHKEATNREVVVDKANKVITAPCYMMDSTLLEIRNNAKQAVEALAELV